jgi:hypothetical protein
MSELGRPLYSEISLIRTLEMMLIKKKFTLWFGTAGFRAAGLGVLLV